MKWIVIYFVLTFKSVLLAQSGLFINGFDASLKVDSLAFISIDGDFYNINCDPVAAVRFNGSLFVCGSFINNDSLKFTATTGSFGSKKAKIIFKSGTYTSTLNPGPVIGGSVSPNFWEVEFDRGTGSYLYLQNNIRCFDTLTFTSGLCYMNGYKWKFIDPVGTPNVINHPFMKNERNFSQFVSASFIDTGLVIYNTIYTQSLNINPANLGLSISGPLNIGSPLKIIRGFKPQVNAAKYGIQRYFDVYSPGHSLLANTLKLRYTLNDMSMYPFASFNLNDLTLYASQNTDMNWSELVSVNQNTLSRVSTILFDGELSAQLSDFNSPMINLPGESFRITIADPNCTNPPVSALVLDTVHICAGDTLILDAGNNSSVSNSSLKWEWQTTPALYSQTLKVSPNNAYQKYNVTLKDVRGCITRDSVIIAPAEPFPQIIYLNHLNACLGDSVLIKDTVQISSGTFINRWIFSDNDSAMHVLQSFKKKFPSVGSHALQLTSTSNYGCKVTAGISNIIVYPLPTAAFSSSLNCSTHQINFSNNSTSNHSSLVVASCLWNLGLGAGNTSALFSPAQTYSASGNYSIHLKVTSSFGCVNSTSANIQIFPNNIPVFTKSFVCEEDSTFFLNTTTCNTGPCNYIWKFGDGSVDTNFNAKHKYASAGLYQVKLMVNAPNTCADSTLANVFIHPKPNTNFSTSTSTLCINETGYFNNASSISTGSITSVLWNFGNTSTLSTWNASTSYSMPNWYNVSLIATSDSGCTNTYSTLLFVPLKPNAQFTVNTVCYGNASQFVSSSAGTNLSYLWNFGNSVSTTTTASSVQNYIYPSTGTYSTTLIVNDNWNCSDTSSAIAMVLNSPTPALSGTVSTCGSSYLLNAGNNGSSYFWQPGNQTSQNITVNTNGLYQVVITHTNACASSQSVQVILNSQVTPGLGNDTTVCGPFILNAGYPGGTYVWNTFATTQTISASNSGSYAVQVTDQNQCVGFDTINITVYSPAIISLGNDINACKPKYGIILTPTSNAQNFLWNNGSTNSTVTINQPGLYWCEVQLPNSCKSRDSVNVNFLATPTVDLGNDSSSCSPILLNAKNNNLNYLWQDGSNSQTYFATNSSNYWVVVTNSLTNCSQFDSIQLTIYPTVKINLGNDTSICNNSGFSLFVPNNYASYQWTNGSTASSLAISSTGIYGVTVTSVEGCSAVDFIQITSRNAPQVELGSDINYICGNNEVVLQLSNQTNAHWFSNKGLSVFSNSISTNSEAKYWAEVSENGCSSSDTILLVSTSNTIHAHFLASTLDTINKPVQFVNLSSPAPTAQLWTFGDGTQSFETNPLHTYVLPSNYSITLEVTNGYCTDRITKELNALFRPGEESVYASNGSLELMNFIVYPNPSSQQLNFQFDLNLSAEISVTLMDLSGRIVDASNGDGISTVNEFFDLTDLNNGLYVLRLSVKSKKGNLQKNIKIIKVNE